VFWGISGRTSTIWKTGMVKSGSGLRRLRPRSLVQA
jgi:hypothetical protein